MTKLCQEFQFPYVHLAQMLPKLGYGDFATSQLADVDTVVSSKQRS